jgi:hypothetical protein
MGKRIVTYFELLIVLQNGLQHGLYANRAIDKRSSAVVILTEHLYFGRAF